MADPASRGRRTFMPVVALGAAAGVVATIASGKDWIVSETAQLHPVPTGGSAATSPLAAALGLVVLACWGVVLVTRGVVRRAVAVLGAVGGVGLAVAVIVGRWTVEEGVRSDLLRTFGSDPGDTRLTSWWWVALLTSLVVVATTLAGAAWVGHWPEMGAKYDAPTGQGPSTASVPEDSEADNRDIWKALDEGRDPTA